MEQVVKITEEGVVEVYREDGTLKKAIWPDGQKAWVSRGRIYHLVEPDGGVATVGRKFFPTDHED